MNSITINLDSETMKLLQEKTKNPEKYVSIFLKENLNNSFFEKELLKDFEEAKKADESQFLNLV